MEKTAIEKARTAEVQLYKQATDVAGLCRDIVVKKAITIGNRKFVPVEAWTTIAVAHGCIATIKLVEQTPDGVRAVAEIKRQSDGMALTSAEGFVGADEAVWYGGEVKRWNKFKKAEETVTLPRRENYAIRAMAQTRAVSRACRTAFSHVVVLMDAGLSTTPYEEVATEDERDAGDVGHTGEIDDRQEKERAAAAANQERKNDGPGKTEPTVPRDVDPKMAEQFKDNKWEAVVMHFGKNKGSKLGDLEKKSLRWYVDEWQPKPFGNKPISDDDKLLRAALDVAGVEGFKE